MIIEDLHMQARLRVEVDLPRILVFDDYHEIDYKKQDQHFARIASKYNGLVGYMQLDITTYDDVYLVDNIYVHTDYRRSKIATEIYRRAFEIAKRNRRELASYEPMRSRRASELWKKAGFYTDERGLDIMERKP